MSRYEELGVDVKKKGIDSFKSFITNLYPGAFCVIQKDPANPKMGLVTHTDSAGSKPIMAYINYKETGDASWFNGLPQDALAMNINDLVCVGADPVTFVDYVAFNTLVIERIDMLAALSSGFGHCIKVLNDEGIPILFAGGETADLPDLVRTLDVSVTMFGRTPLANVITGSEIKPGDVIVGVRSGGKIRYEKGENSGIMSNGHTLARSSLISPEYVGKYPEISHPSKGRYTGPFKYDDFLNSLDSEVGEALLCPTRLFAPIALKVLSKHRKDIHGMVHNTGGGNTKCIRLGSKINYVKDTMPKPDPIFNLIKEESGVTWQEMYQDFNMGIGFEFIVDPDVAEDVLSIVDGYGVGVSIIGRCTESDGENSLRIESSKGAFFYN